MSLTPPPYSQPLYHIQSPHSNDVLSGRGVTTNRHEGNTNFRSLVALNKELYVTSTKRQKMQISRSVVDAVRSMDPPGRFLEKNPDTGLWSDIGDRKAIEKTSQALRDGAASLRKQLSEDLGDPDFLSAVFDDSEEAAMAVKAAEQEKEKQKEKQKVIKQVKPLKKGHRRSKSDPDSINMSKSKIAIKKARHCSDSATKTPGRPYLVPVKRDPYSPSEGYGQPYIYATQSFDESRRDRYCYSNGGDGGGGGEYPPPIYSNPSNDEHRPYYEPMEHGHHHFVPHCASFDSYHYRGHPPPSWRPAPRPYAHQSHHPLSPTMSFPMPHSHQFSPGGPPRHPPSHRGPPPPLHSPRTPVTSGGPRWSPGMYRYKPSEGYRNQSVSSANSNGELSVPALSRIKSNASSQGSVPISPLSPRFSTTRSTNWTSTSHIQSPPEFIPPPSPIRSQKPPEQILIPNCTSPSTLPTSGSMKENAATRKNERNHSSGINSDREWLPAQKSAYDYSTYRQYVGSVVLESRSDYHANGDIEVYMTEKTREMSYSDDEDTEDEVDAVNHTLAHTDITMLDVGSLGSISPPPSLLQDENEVDNNNYDDDENDDKLVGDLMNMPIASCGPLDEGKMPAVKQKCVDK